MDHIEQECYASQADLDVLTNKVEGGLLEMRRNQCRTETQFLEVRKELNHHSQLLTDLKQDVGGLKQDVSGLKQDVNGLKQRLDEHSLTLQEHSNLLKQILEVVSHRH